MMEAPHISTVIYDIESERFISKEASAKWFLGLLLTSNAKATVEDGVVTGVTITNPGKNMYPSDIYPLYEEPSVSVFTETSKRSSSS